MSAMWVQLKDCKTRQTHLINFNNINFVKETFDETSNEQVYLEFKGGGCLRLNITISEIDRAIWLATARLTM